jgi:chromosome segregation ATPase
VETCLAAEVERLREVRHDDGRIAELGRRSTGCGRGWPRQAGAAPEQRMREQLVCALERGSASSQQDLPAALAAARRAEAARAALAAEQAELRAELSRLGACAVQVESLQATLAAVESERACLVDARTRSEELGVRLAERERALEEMRAAHAAETNAAAARIDALAVDCDQLRTAAAALEAERNRLGAAAEGAVAARARLEEALEQGLEEARAQERELSERLGARERELESVRAQWGTAVAAAAARVETLATDCKELRAAMEGLRGERDRLAAEAEGAVAARARLEEALERRLEEARARECELSERLGAAERELATERAQWASTASAAEARLRR